MEKKITDVSIRKMAGIPGETQKVSIGGGLFLWVTINRGGQTAKVWYLRYYDAEGKRQRSKLGNYPDISLAKAQSRGWQVTPSASVNACKGICIMLSVISP